MRKCLWIAGSVGLLMLQCGCAADQQQPTTAEVKKESGVQKRGGLKANVAPVLPEPSGTDDSPIIVGSGSLHIRQHDYDIFPLDGQHYSINVAKHEARSIQFGNCRQNAPVNPGQCQWDLNAPITAGAPWTLQLNGSDGSAAATMTMADAHFPQFILLSTYNPLSWEDDNGGDGEGYMTGNASLGGAQLTTNGNTLANWKCTPVSGMSCTIRIRYCKQGIPENACN